MTELAFDHVELDSKHGHRVQAMYMPPAEAACGIIQIFHGLGEHSARYERFAKSACRRGFAVAIHDHRGHGPARETAGYFGPAGSWQYLIDDAFVVMRYACSRSPDLPYALLGHSMGSFLAQNFAMQHGDSLTALLLSGSTWPSRWLSTAGNVLAQAECLRLGERHCSPLLDKLGFGNFNRAFEPARTEFDWLSSDTIAVDRYIADPLCGGPYSAGLWRELTAALRELGNEANLRRIPMQLPILITGGAADPVGGSKGLRELAGHYSRSGHARVQLKIYADGRHEMLNEINFERVTADWLDWLATAIR